MKDYQKLQENVTSENELTSKEIKELGYTTYDISVFVEAGILTRVRRGVYSFNKQKEEKEAEALTPVEDVKSTVVAPNKPEPSEEIDKNINHMNQGIYHIIKRDYVTARACFNKELDFNPDNSKTLYGIFATYIFEEKYENAYEALVASVSKSLDDTIVPNYYVCLELLKEYIEVDEELIDSLLLKLSGIKTAKMGSNTKKMIKAVQDKDYPAVYKFICYNIGFDVKSKKYHLTNRVLHQLCESILRKKGLYQEKEERVQKEQSDSIKQNNESLLVEEPIKKSAEIVIVPQITEETLLPNLLIEAINQNDFERAISILESSNIENPKEVIKALLTKLQLLKSLLTTENKIKVVATEEVTIVDENKIKVAESEDSKGVEKIFDSQEQTILEETTPRDNHEQQDATPTEIVVKEPPVLEIDMATLAYKGYKDKLDILDFDEALKDLRRYDYIMSTTSRKRNLGYHYNRIEACKKDFALNPNNYIKKRQIASEIFNLKKCRKYDEALALIEEYKSISGYNAPTVIVCEAEIYYARNNYDMARKVLERVALSEEPTYYFLKAHLDYKTNKIDDALQSCIAYNERRPRTTIAIYVLMGDIYKRKGKAGKAAKTYRIAQEIGVEQGKNVSHIAEKIEKAEYQSDENRSLRFNKNKK